MNILLSAYACEPNKGSEPGVGWSWAIELAKHHSVWVITRDNNQSIIEDYLKKEAKYPNKNLHFVYVSLPKIITFWKKGRRGIHLYYILWQHRAEKIARRLCEKIKFDLVQHVTFVSYTQPTYMYQLGIPMIWGPVSGGENIPDNVIVTMSVREKLVEKIRVISQIIAPLIPSIRKTMEVSEVIFVATEETLVKIPRKYHWKTVVLPAIGLESLPKVHRKERTDKKIKIIMAGRLIYWKAFDIGITAFLKIADRHPEAELYILGEGERKQSLMHLAELHKQNQIFFLDAVDHDRIYEFYAGFDIFLNTTLRDSGCMTMMEAMSVGLSCIAIALGGPRKLLEGVPGSLIEADENEKLIESLSIQLEKMIEDKEFRNRLGEACRKKSIEHLTSSRYEKFMDAILRLNSR